MRSYIAAAGLLLLATPAFADSTSTFECWHEGLRKVCASEYKSPYSATRTECFREPGRGLTCETTSKHKPLPEPERPVLPPSVERASNGVVIMRGMPDR